MKTFTIVKDVIKNVRRFNVRGRTVEFKIKPVPEGEEAITWTKRAINDIILHAMENIEPTDQVGFTFCSKDFKKGQGWKKFRQASEVTVDDVWDLIGGIFQSNSTGLSTDTLCFGVTTVRLPKGSGKRQNMYNSFNEESAKRRGIVPIDNKDNLCLPRAIIVAIAHKTKDPNYRQIRLDTGKIQTKRVNELLEKTRVVIPNDGCGINELREFQNYFGDKYKICVYRYGSKGRDVMFEGGQAGVSLNILHHKGHYNVITSLTAAFCCSYYCEQCHAPYFKKNEHRCGDTCQSCQQTPACPQGIKIKCNDCNRWFKNSICFNNHKKENSLSKNTVCSVIVCCPTCLKTVKKGRIHNCGEIYCKVCNQHQPEDHLCLIQPDTGKPKTDDFLFVFYDLETRQEKIIDDNTVEHEPNLCVSKQCCATCINEHNLYFCQQCGFKTQIFKNNVIESFMKQVLEARKKFKTVVVIAHNGQAFDHQFVLNHILIKSDLAPKLIMRGTKIISMTVGNLKFLDSLNYFPMALSKLPAAFGLPDVFKKGYFPHFFNTIDNANYIGNLPALSYYSPETMKKEDRAKFLEWYEEHKTDEFNMQQELVNYCISDVDILMRACLKFREQLISTGNVCPFTEACTIASTCNKVFRRNFLQPNTIGVIPKGGYQNRDNQSKIATQWLIWEEKQRGINILHSAKNKEARLGGLKVDGFSEETNQVFEFNGCYFHGHTCLKYNRDKPLKDSPSETLEQRYESTLAKADRLRSLGYEVIEMWECQFQRKMQESPEIEQYTSVSPLLASVPLQPRDAFYGGRTGNTKTYYKAKEGEKIKYIDVCSLYPWVCKNGKFPVAHPEVYVGSNCPKDITNLDGVIKCTLLPPQTLYHPVLPIKRNNKLLFSLCNTCSIEQSATECNHGESERAITGTWIVDEVKKAIEKGYKLLNVIEFWKYSVIQYDSETKIGGLFTEMMNKFLKIKQQASGWPKNCNTDEEKDRYIETFFNQEGIRLEFAEILENAGLRALAKLMLNSFWGKFGENPEKAKTRIINKPDEFFDMMTDPTLIVNSVLPVNDDTLVVNYEHTEESRDVLSTVNVCIAAYTTAQARLKLYSYLEQLGNRCLYYDTDSVIFISREGEEEPELGDCVGDMTDELSCYGSGSYITEFASGGPKTYAFIAYSPTTNKYHEVCKVKGICINHEVGKDVNFNTLKDMIVNCAEPRKIAYKAIRRTLTHEVITKDGEKVFKPTSTKRKFEGYNSVPYGYKKLHSEQNL